MKLNMFWLKKIIWIQKLHLPVTLPVTIISANKGITLALLITEKSTVQLIVPT
jgi:hypothetical protein